MKVQSISLLLIFTLTFTIFSSFPVSSEYTTELRSDHQVMDTDGDGRPDEFEIEQGLNESENDVEWTFLVYCCGDDAPLGNRIGTLLPEMWEFIEKLSWVGCTDNINIVVQFDGNDQLYGNHQDMFWNDIPNNQNRSQIAETSTRRFLVGKDTMGWDPSIILQRSCTNNTMIDLYDVTDWDPKDTGRSHDSLEWEANMADPNVLHEFIVWGMDTFESDNYCLYVDSHGDGVTGFGYDHRPDNDPTTTVKDVLNLSDIGTVADLMSNEEPPKRLEMVMLQSCLMGNIEFAYEFSRFSDHFVASENVMHITGNQDDVVLEILDDDPDMTPERLARQFIDTEYKWSRDGITNPPWNIMDWDGRERLTFTSIDNNYLIESNLIPLSGSLNRAILEGVDTDFEWYVNALKGSISDQSTDCYTNELGYTQIDYLNFLAYWIGIDGPDDGIFNRIRDLSFNISGLLWNDGGREKILEYHMQDFGYFQKTAGIAIYLPFSPAEWNNNSEYYKGSRFDIHTGWSEVIEIIHENFPPAVTSVDRVVSFPEEPAMIEFTATDVNGDTISLAVDSSDTPFELIVGEHLSLSFNATREQVGVYQISLKFDDGNGSSTYSDLEIEIIPYNIPLVVGDVLDQTAYVGEEFIFDLLVYDENANDEISAEHEFDGAGNCWIDDDWKLHILPLEEDLGLKTVSISISDNNGSIEVISFNLTVIWRNLPPSGPDELNISISSGDIYQQNFSIIDPDGNPMKMEVLYQLPDWLNISFLDRLIILASPSSEDIGSYRFTIHFDDNRGGLLIIRLKFDIVESKPPVLLMPESITLQEREDISFRLNSDYSENGTVVYSISAGNCDFLTLEEDIIMLAPFDGDRGIYDILIISTIINGSVSISDLRIIVESNFSDLELDIEISPGKGPYSVGDMVIVEVLYHGYEGDLKFNITIMVDDVLVLVTQGPETSFTVPMGSEISILVSGYDEDIPVEPVFLTIEKGEEVDTPDFSVFIMIFALVLVVIIVVAGVIFNRGKSGEVDEAVREE